MRLLVCAILFLGACSSNEKRAETIQLPDLDVKVQESYIAFDEANEAFDDGDIERAIQGYQEAVRLWGDNGQAWNNLGLAHMEVQDFRLALDAFKRAAERMPTDPRPYENMGLLWHRRYYYADAIQAYSKALERDPQSIKALRGVVLNTKLANVATQESVDIINRALLIDGDAEWTDVYLRERSRVKRRLEEEERLRAREAG
ncbi:MAG: tetratricopeptide repeat protein [Phycisphaerales bacterium]|nr:tetratricopeptide repeat protein [Phycisphaerales bacterium]